MAVNPISLENLKQPKQKKQGHGHRYAIPTEKIDALFACIADGDSLKIAATKVDISYTTAKKYFDEGDMKRGIQPLKKRLMIFQEKISEKINALAEEQRLKRLEFVNKAIAKMEEKMIGTPESKDGKTPAVDGELPAFKFNDYERMVKLQNFLSGGSRTKEVERKIMTAEEVMGQ